MNIRDVVSVLSCTLVLAVPVFAWRTELDDYLTSFTSPSAQQTMGVRTVRRADHIENRLEVVFQDTTSPSRRSQVLADIGQHFLRWEFQEHGIQTVTVIERDEAGGFRDEVVVNMGAPTTTSESSAPSSTIPMKGSD